MANSVTAVLIDDAPLDHTASYRPTGIDAEGDYTGDTGPVLTEFYEKMVAEPHRAALLDLVTAGFDGGACAVCGGWVGYGLAGDADERTEWRPVVLVHVDRRDSVTRLCEDCGAVLDTCGIRVSLDPVLY